MSRGSSRVFSFDPGRPSLPDGLEAPAEGAGEIVVLLADVATRAAGWTGSFAITVAEAWGSSAADVILADGDLTTSSLHELVGAPNVEGVSDVVRYGASTNRVARPVGSRSFRFIPKGTIVPDPESVYSERRWADWLTNARDAGIVMVLSLPSEIEGVSGLTAGADRIVVLTGDDVDAPDDERVAVVRAAVSTAPSEPPDAAGAPSPSEKPDRVERLVTTSPGKGTKGRSKGSEAGPGKILLLAFLVVVLVMIVLAWLGLVSIPGLSGVPTG